MGNSFKYICFVFVLFIIYGFSINQNKFYQTLSSEKISSINNYLAILEKEKKTPTNNAYWGALTAKKASFEKGASAKIKTFKTGVKQLEQEISKHPRNAEYRFLRLSIQEHCPKLLKYNKNIIEDAQVVSANYSKQNKTLKKVIFKYAMQSKGLDSKLLR